MHAIVPYTLAEEEGERFLEGFAETVSHESINNRVEGRVSIRHAISPRLNLIGFIVHLEMEIEALKKQVELDRTPANGKKKHNHYNHLGNLSSHGR